MNDFLFKVIRIGNEEAKNRRSKLKDYCSNYHHELVRSSSSDGRCVSTF